MSRIHEIEHWFDDHNDISKYEEEYRNKFESTPSNEDIPTWFTQWFAKDKDVPPIKLDNYNVRYGVWHDVVTMQPKMNHREIIPVLRSLWRQGHGLIGKLSWYIPEGSFIFIFLHSYQGILKDFYVYTKFGGPYFRPDGRLRDPIAPMPPSYELSDVQFRELVSMFCSALINFFDRNPDFKARNIAWLMLLRAYPMEYPLNNFITRGYSLNDNSRYGIHL